MTRLLPALLLLPALAWTQDTPEDYWIRKSVLAREVDRKPGLVYAEVGDRKLRLDLYRPKDRAGEVLPGILFIHGGAWRMGDRNTCSRQSMVLAREGYAVACIEYRLVPHGTILNCVEDCKAAVRWLRANAARHGVDPGRIGAIGGSAGGHLVSMLALTHLEQGLEGAGGNPDVSSRVQAAVAMATPCDLDNGFIRKQFKLDAEAARRVSPLRYAHAQQAPLMLLHCKKDGLVPYFSSVALKLACKDHGECELVEIRQGGHPFWHSPAGLNETMAAALPFFARHLPPPSDDEPKGTTP